VEYCKAYARSKRYAEDIRTLHEEMRRTITFGYKAALWDVHAAEELPDSSPELTEGRRAYAAEHADTERSTCKLLERNWGAILQRADVYLEGTLVADTTLPVTVEMDIGDELAPDEEEALLEGEDE
jgi:hypothetical protein